MFTQISVLTCWHDGSWSIRESREPTNRDKLQVEVEWEASVGRERERAREQVKEIGEVMRREKAEGD
jgi:hypothetical protein